MSPAGGVAKVPRKGTRIAATTSGTTMARANITRWRILWKTVTTAAPFSSGQSLFKRREPFVQLQHDDVLGTQETPLRAVRIADDESTQLGRRDAGGLGNHRDLHERVFLGVVWFVPTGRGGDEIGRWVHSPGVPVRDQFLGVLDELLRARSSVRR